MKNLTFLQTTRGGTVKKIILFLFVLGVLFLILRDIVWSYDSFESGMGKRMAQIAVSYHVVLLLGMFVVGIGLGHLVNRMMRDRKAIFCSPRKGGKTEKLMQLWGYELKKEETIALTDTPTEFDPSMMEPIDLIDLPARRGRKPVFTLKHWLPIAMKWENRDPLWDDFTLAELISEHLGTNPDGSPIISEQTYYSVWRKRAIVEMQRRAKTKKAGTVTAQEKERHDTPRI